MNALKKNKNEQTNLFYLENLISDLSIATKKLFENLPVNTIKKDIK